MRARGIVTTLLWLLAAAFAGATVWFLLGDLPDRLSVGDRSGLIAAVTGVLTLGVSVAALLLPRTEQSRRAQLEAAHQELVQQVNRQWNDEAAGRKLHQTDPIRIRLSPSNRPIAAPPGPLVGQRDPKLVSSTTVTKLAAAWQHSPKRRWVIIGKPGSGKTTALVILLQEILDPDPELDAPVPVLFNLADWDPEQTDLTTWLSHQLAHNYLRGRSQRKLASRLVRTQRIIPFLDGLDEMPESLRALAIDRLAAHDPRRPMVFTSRIDEYEAAVTKRGVVLKDTIVAELQEVKPKEAIEYLRSNMVDPDKWNPIADKLDDDPEGPLAAALTSPLMIYLLRESYIHDSGLRDIIALRNRQEIEAHLLDRYVSTMYSSGKGPVEYGSDRAGRWLDFIAMTLSENEKVGFTWWRLHEYLVGHRIRFEVLHGCFVAGFVGCAMAVLIEWQSMDPDIGYGASMEVSATKGATVGLLLGVLTVLTNVFSMTPRMPVQTPETNDRMHSANLMRSFGIGTLAGASSIVLSLRFDWWPAELFVLIGTVIQMRIIGMVLAADVLSRSFFGHAYLACTRKLPLRLSRFLNDAHRRGVLRQVGIEYQFRHVKLQEHLAASYRGAEGKDHALSASSSR